MKNLKNNQSLINEKSIGIDGINLSYFLYRSQKKTGGRYVYSVGITVSSEDTTESSFIYDITRTRSRAEEIFCLLYEGTVTPCTLSDIIEDIL